MIIEEVAADLPALAREICSRHFGAGSDGLLICRQSACLEMVMFNPDGSLGEMCGNGLRCFARWASNRGLFEDRGEILTGAGLKQVELHSDGQVSVDMGRARFEGPDLPPAPFLNKMVEAAELKLPGSTVSMGNPHLVLECDNIESIDADEAGPQFEKHPSAPQGYNVHFVQILSSSRIKAKTWERGAGVTLACGSGACAILAAMAEQGKADRSAEIEMPGGVIRIDLDQEGQITMTGPADYVYRGEWLIL